MVGFCIAGGSDVFKEEVFEGGRSLALSSIVDWFCVEGGRSLALSSIVGGFFDLVLLWNKNVKFWHLWNFNVLNVFYFNLKVVVN